MTPAETVKAIRERLGLTQAEFAVRLNHEAPGLRTIQKDVSRWESGERNPHPATLELIRRMTPLDED